MLHSKTMMILLMIIAIHKQITFVQNHIIVIIEAYFNSPVVDEGDS